MADAVGFLIGDVARLLRRAFDARAREIGVTRNQWRMLTTLARNEGVNQGRLAELLDVEPITLCRMIDRLSESGLVERRADPNDRRAWRVHLTSTARPIIERLRALADDLLDDAMQGLSDPERSRMAELLERMRANLTDTEFKQRIEQNG